MTLKNDFKVAVDALRVAFKSALDDPTFDDATLAETWRHFLGMQAIHKKLPDEISITFNQQNMSSTTSTDTISFSGADEGFFVHGFGAAQAVSPFDGGYTAPAGQDVLTFS